MAIRNIFFTISILLIVSAFAAKAQSASSKNLKHIVTVTFTPNASQNEIKEVDNSFKGLAKLEVVKGYEWGIAPINDRNKEHKHSFAFTFSSMEDFGKYAASPEHQKHIKVGVAITQKVEAVQYFVEK
jgi:hypothetical protein